MSYFDNQPLRYFKGYPIYLTGYLTLAMAIGIVIVVFLESAGVSSELLVFNSRLFLRGWVWQPFTYIFVNQISFFTPLGLFCFYSWGVQVEQFLGRRRFLAVCAILVGVPVAYCLGLHAFRHPAGAQSNYFLICGILIAYATIYPDMEYIGWVPLKWFAFACVFCGSLMYFPNHAWLELVMLWLDCFAGYACIQYARGNFTLPKFKMPSLRSTPKFRVVPKTETRRGFMNVELPVVPEESEEVNSINPLLDKIAKSGLDSLTPAERRKLDQARENLLKKNP